MLLIQVAKCMSVESKNIPVLSSTEALLSLLGIRIGVSSVLVQPEDVMFGF